MLFFTMNFWSYFWRCMTIFPLWNYIYIYFFHWTCKQKSMIFFLNLGQLKQLYYIPLILLKFNSKVINMIIFEILQKIILFIMQKFHSKRNQVLVTMLVMVLKKHSLREKIIDFVFFYLLQGRRQNFVLTIWLKFCKKLSL